MRCPGLDGLSGAFQAVPARRTIWRPSSIAVIPGTSRTVPSVSKFAQADGWTLWLRRPISTRSRGLAWAFISGAWRVSDNMAIRSKPPLPRSGLRPATEAVPSLHPSLWVGQGACAQGAPAERLARWLSGMENAILTATRHMDDIETWLARAEATMAPLTGKTPRVLLSVLTEWPLVSAPMTEAMTGVSRAAVQRNLAWMEEKGLIREVTGQGRFRMWRAVA